MGQSPHEALDDRMVQIRRHNTGTIRGQSNLLLVMPAFRQFSGRIKPIQGRLFSRPTDSESSRGKRVESLMETSTLFTGHPHQIDQKRRA